MSKKFGVYCIINNIDFKVYVGKGVRQNNGNCYRWNIHLKQDRLIGRALRKHGIENFTFGWLETDRTEYASLMLEQKWIAFWKANIHRHGNDFGYNLTDGGEGSAGHLHTDETRQKITAAQTGKTRCQHTAETKAKLAAKIKGVPRGPHSESHKQKIAAAKKGKPGPRLSEEHKRKISAGNLGKHRGPVTDEHKQKLRDAWVVRRSKTNGCPIAIEHE